MTTPSQQPARPAWAQQTRILLEIQPGRAGRLTPAGQYRANGGRWPCPAVERARSPLAGQ